MAKKEHPYLTANWLSKLTFWWMNSLFYLGYKKGIKADDLYETLPDHRADYLTDKIERTYYSPKAPKKRRLLWTVVTAFKGQLLLTAVFALMLETIKICQPIIVGELVTYFKSNVTDTSNNDGAVSDNVAYILGAVLAFSSFLLSFPNAWYFYINQIAGMQMRTACSNLIYNKSLRISQGTLHKISTGKVVNLMSTDVEKFNMGTLFYHYLWISPLETIVITILLYTEVGLSCLPGLLFILLLMPLQGYLAKVFGKIRYQIADWTDRRIHVMGEIIGAMRVIKMYCWEKPFGTLVAKLRKKEMSYIWRGSNIKGQNQSLSFVSPKIVTFLIFLMYYLTGNEITAETVVKVISWTELIKSGMLTYLTLAVQYTTELMASLNRIEDFLQTDELKVEDTQDKVRLAAIEQAVMNNNEVITMQNMSASWIEDKEMPDKTLTNINLHVQAGELVAIIGDVGAGKSSILMSLLGELPPSSGLCNVSGEVSYVPQEAWVFQGTVRENILFGDTFKNEEYWNAVKACSLDKDFQLMENQDATTVGEKGFSLSGGQKARLNLARATYREADIYLLDDPLSAVDTKVARHLFEKCICGKLKGKTRILVTHQVQFLRRADQIIVMKDGQIHASGSFAEVTKFVDVTSFVASEKEKDGQENALNRDHQRKSGRHPSKSRDKASSFRGEGSIGRSFHHRRSSSLDTVSSHPGDLDLAILDDFGEAAPTVEEDIFKGSVGFSVYKRYFAAGNGVILMPAFLILSIAFQAVLNTSDWMLSEWEYSSDQDRTLYIYCGFVAGVFVLGALRSLAYFSMTSLSSQNLHNRIFTVLLRAPISFFDKNPVGRILNRFSRDMGFMDDMLPQTMMLVLQYLVSFLGSLVLVSVSNPWTILLTVPVMIWIIVLRQYALKATRDIKRIEATSRSPLYSHLSATLVGLPVIRAFKMQPTCIKDFNNYQDEQSSPWLLFLATQRWFGTRLDWTIAIYFFCYILAAFLTPRSAEDGGVIGLSLSYITALLGIFQFTMRQSAETESFMTSVERVLEYTEIAPEAEEFKSNFQPPPGWPSSGNLQFKDMCLAYSKDAANVIKNVDLTIKNSEKIGIVGRTGAGKSSLITCLMRLSEPTGQIIIDGVNVLELGLYDLRSAVSIIPQDPVLFTGTMRYNLDPLSEYKDDQLWNALAQVQLTEKVRSMDGGLYGEMSESGGNLSVGQRQLVCLARAILRNKKILLIDEATANVDPHTDALIQKTLRTNFTECTVLCIAHRLNTIIDSDKVVVMDQGKVAEFDHPHMLLQNERGNFHQMVLQTGPQTEQKLHSLAKAAYYDKIEGNDKTMQYHRMDSVGDTKIQEENERYSSSLYENINPAFIDETEDNYLSIHL